MSIVTTILESITSFGSGIAKAVVDLFTTLMFVTSEAGAITGLTAFGTVFCVFIGFGLVTGIVFWFSKRIA